MQSGHMIDEFTLILNSGKQVDIRNLINESFINSELEFITADMLVVGENPRIVHSGERQLTCLVDTLVIYKEKSLICRELKNVHLGLPDEHWQINLGGKVIDSTGLTRRNHIKQINWDTNTWQETLLFENDFEKLTQK